MPESKHTAKLREFGFLHQPQDPGLSQFQRDAARLGETFSIFCGPNRPLKTIAIDENGEQWVAAKHIDLCDLGFTDTSAEMRQVGEIFGLTKKSN